VTVLLLAWLAAAPAQAPRPTVRAPPAGRPAPTAAGKTPVATPENPVDVQCDRARMEGNQQRFICTGHVRMVRKPSGPAVVGAEPQPTIVTCDRLVGHYLGKDAQQVTRLECFGNVEAVSGDRWARGDKADYDTVKELLIVTGNPEARQGNNQMKGELVRFYVDTDLIEVDRVKGVLESKGKEPGAKKAPAQAP
jgi:lipopolysaccharide export system protein LptA